MMVVGVFLVIFVLAATARAIPRSPKVRAKPLFTDRECAARAIIERTLPDVRVHVQVWLGALLQPARRYNRDKSLRVRSRFSQEIVDFVIEDRMSGAILALVESDDCSHDLVRDRQRDAMTASAGYRTIRLPFGRINAQKIGARLQSLVPAK